MGNKSLLPSMMTVSYGGAGEQEREDTDLEICLLPSLHRGRKEKIYYQRSRLPESHGVSVVSLVHGLR